MSQQCFSSRSGAVVTRRVVLVQHSPQLIFAVRFCIHAKVSATVTMFTLSV